MSETPFDRVLVGQSCSICNGAGKLQGDPLTGDNDPMFPVFPCIHCHGTGVVNQHWASMAELLGTVTRILRSQTGMRGNMEYKGGQPD